MNIPPHLARSGPFSNEPDPDNPGWHSWNLTDTTRFNAFLGNLLVKPPENGFVRMRMLPERRHSNVGNAVHGGISLAFIDIGLFAGARLMARNFGERAVTLELTTHFIAAGVLDIPMDVVVELVRETRSLYFLRGSLVQAKDGAEGTICSFSGILKGARNPDAGSAA